MPASPRLVSKRQKAALAGCLALALGACAADAGLAREGHRSFPGLLSTRLLAIDADAEGATVLIEARLGPARDQAVVLDRYEYSLLVDGRQAGRGVATLADRLPTGESPTARLSARLRWADLPGSLRTPGARRAANLELDGVVFYHLGAEPLAGPVSASAVVALPSSPTLVVLGARLREDAGLKVEVRYRVTNPNPFALPAGVARYEVASGSTLLARGGGVPLAAVPAAGQEERSLLLDVSLVDALLALARLPAGETSEARISGEATFGPFPAPISGRFTIAR